MFDKNKFASILKRINEQYENQTSFAKASGVNRTYLSQYMNLSLNNPPSPKILMGIANASKSITTYNDLMYMCGYTNTPPLGYGIVDRSIEVLTLFISSNGKLEPYNDLWVDRCILAPGHQYFGYQSNDDSMLPLLGKGDIAIIEKTTAYGNGNTCLISLDDTTIFIRKILDFKDYIELHTTIQYNQPIKLTIDEIEKRNFKVLGKVIRAENESAFK